MSTNQIYALILLTVYAMMQKVMPTMDFNNGNFIAAFVVSCVISFIITFKLVK